MDIASAPCALGNRRWAESSSPVLSGSKPEIFPSCPVGCGAAAAGTGVNQHRSRGVTEPISLPRRRR
ncbi:hypothetical protein HMPREF1549_03322 [Actinomyces johnsonii F0510]|uniref:Uncharacterized protein n=1 Tax=Actinomyces johnsonii F0510 TaxID=1227262 RepID=U1R9J5_9ACTO|nr:hypothetical protein HMPREF1549_03322 [Actinomyces johnsonii F0510]